jgi:isopentenyldiphosphate isomerase
MQKIVSIVLMNKSNEFLLLKRSPARKSYPNKWNFISETVKENEAAGECARRCLKKEIGNKAVTKLVKKGKTFIDSQNEGEWEVTPFLFEYLGGELIINLEHIDRKWIRKEDIFKFSIVPGILDDLIHLDL